MLRLNGKKIKGLSMAEQGKIPKRENANFPSVVFKEAALLQKRYVGYEGNLCP